MRWIITFLLLCWMQSPVCAQTIADAEAHFNEGDEFYDDHDLIKAKLAYQKALDILKKCNATNLLLYHQVLFELAELAEETEDYYAAVRYMEQAIAVENDTVKKATEESDGILSPLRKLSDFYAQAGMWEKALSLKRQNLKRKWQNRHIGNFDNALEDYMYWIENTNDFKFAFRILKDLHEKDEDNLFYNYWIGECYYQLGDYDQALVCFEKVKPNIGLAKVYASKGDVEKAIDIQKTIVADNQENKGHRIYVSGHYPYGRDLSLLADLYIQNAEYDKAILCEEQNEVTKTTCLNLGKAYAGKKQWHKAIEYALKAYNLNQQESSRAFVSADLSHYYYMVNDKSNLQKYVYKILSFVTIELVQTIQELTYDERSKYIERYTELLNEQIPMYAYYVHSDTLTSLTYDASLLMKGALLNSENSVRRVIYDSNDPAFKDLWEELRADRYILNKQLGKDSIDRKINIDSLQNVIYNLEDSLVVKCKEYDDITKSMKLKWPDIQNQLLSQDVAIEFLRIPINNDSVMYAALTLRKDSECPKMTALFEEKQLKEVSDTLWYQCKEMADLVWKPLASELQGVKNIYFSPSGALYNIGIEYLPGMDEYNLYRLSSTRELVTNRETKTANRAVLYGGLDYYAELDTLSKKKSITTLNDTFVEHADVRGLGIRGGKNRLPHTKDEVEEIAKELRKSNWTCQLDTASTGTEESFKSLSVKSVNMLHIATHGFYYTPDEADNTGYRFLQLDNHLASAEDKALTRSGLIMSGANHILEGDTLPDYVEDGILTAKEIADVDLRGLDLVVLSACQTGLGDISQGEGVFGLQRGFKKAGANSILMSLWEVEDEATQILMTQFYKNLVSGQSKRQSLLSAQKYLREIENGKYNEPKYWAAFILLDALE